MFEQYIFLLRYFALASGVLLGASLVLGDFLRFGVVFRQRRIRLRRTRKLSRYFAAGAFLLLAVLLLGEPALRSWLQYQMWANDPAAKLLLPPHQPWSYFIGYAWFHFWLWRVIGAFLALLVFLAADRFIVRPSAGMRMNRGEAALIAFGIALAGWPYLLIYLVSLLLLYTLILSFFTLKFRFRFWRVAASREKRLGGAAATVSPPGGDEPRRESSGPDHGGVGDRVFSSDVASAQSFRSESEPRPAESSRFPIALPATLALLIIPFSHTILVDWLGLTVFRVTNLSV